MPYARQLMNLCALDDRTDGVEDVRSGYWIIHPPNKCLRDGPGTKRLQQFASTCAALGDIMQQTG